MNEFLTLNFPENELVLLPGTPNDDELLGGLQNEGLLGYDGSDRAVGYGEDDWLFGNTGSDSLYGNIGADVLYGGKDSDYLFGGRDNDILFGNIGNDLLSGELGTDTLIGGEGDDRFLLGSGETNRANADLILDYSGGEDWLELTDGLTFADVEIVSGTGENDTIVRDRATGESIAVLRGFDHSGGTEFGNDEMTLIRLHQIAPQMPQEPVDPPIEPPVEPPAEPVTDAPEDVDGETSVVEIDRDIPQFETEEREVSVDPGNTPEDAYRLEVSSTTLVYSDRVSSSDTEDYYFFSVGAENSLSLDLDIFTGNAQLELLDSNQTVIGSSQDTGSSSNAISAPLDAGTYYIRVQQSDVVTTDYSLNLSVAPRLSGITTTGSQDEFQLFTEESTPLINLTPSDSSDTEAFRTDPRFSDIDGSGYATVILDTGIDLDHPFFGDRIVYSYDFADGDADASDRNGHGSNVSSIVASEDSSYPGIAPGADIIHLKVFPDGSSGARAADIEQALQWVAENADTYNIVSVNMSLGSGNFDEAVSLNNPGYSDEIAALVEDEIMVVAAAGNSFYQYGPGVAYPAADPNVLAVGAVWDGNNGPAFWGDGAIDWSTDADRITSFSQRHPELTDIFAPGAYITGAGPDGSTLTQAGTSQASPHIAGVAVLAQQLAERELGRRLTLDEFRNLLQSTGVTINDGDDEFDNVANTGADYSRVDVLALAEGIVALDSEEPPTPEPDPSDLVRYEFTYFYDGFTTDNDYYTGYVYGAPEELSVGTRYEIYPPINNEAGFNGYYEITDVSVANDGSAEAGEVYVTQYFDVDSSGQSYTPYYFANGGASGFNGIGSEYDFVEVNGTFDGFGRDFAEVDIEEPAVVEPPDDGDDMEPPVVNPPDDGDDMEPPVVEPPDDGGDVDTTEGFFVSNLANSSISRFDATTGDFIEIFVPDGSGGLVASYDLTVGPDGHLYIASFSTDEVLRYNGATGDFIDIFASEGALDGPRDLTFGPDGNLYVNSSETDKVLRYDGQTGDFIDVFASEGGLDSPEAVTFGPDGNLYVSDGFFGKILRYDGQTGDFIDVFASDDGFYSPDGFTFGPDGNLYVTELFNRVLRFDGQTGDFIDVFVPDGSGGLDFARDVTFGPDGNLYVSSSNTDEILRYDGVTGEFIDLFAYNDSLDHPVGLIFVD